MRGFKKGVPRTSLFTYFEGEWSQTGILVQLVSVKIIEGAGKYLFGNILGVNYERIFIFLQQREQRLWDS